MRFNNCEARIISVDLWQMLERLVHKSSHVGLIKWIEIRWRNWKFISTFKLNRSYGYLRSPIWTEVQSARSFAKLMQTNWTIHGKVLDDFATFKFNWFRPKLIRWATNWKFILHKHWILYQYAVFVSSYEKLWWWTSFSWKLFLAFASEHTRLEIRFTICRVDWSIQLERCKK